MKENNGSVVHRRKLVYSDYKLCALAKAIHFEVLNLFHSFLSLIMDLVNFHIFNDWTNIYSLDPPF